MRSFLYTIILAFSLIFIISSLSFAQLTQEERDIRVSSIQKDRKEFLKTYRLELIASEKQIEEELTKIKNIADISEQQIKRKELFKEANKKRKAMQEEFKIKTTNWRLLEEDLLSGGDGNLEKIKKTLKKKAVQRIAPPDFKERNERLNKELQADSKKIPSIKPEPQKDQEAAPSPKKEPLPSPLEPLVKEEKKLIPKESKSPNLRATDWADLKELLQENNPVPIDKPDD